jgi:diacylglycerol kinase (ATP)
VTSAGFAVGAADAVVIINPTSGPAKRGPAGVRVETARRVLEQAGVSHQIYLTERRYHAYDLAAAAVEAGAKLVIAWGGDGTLNEVGQAVAFSDAALGLIPGGSGNGFARELRIPFDPVEALRRALSSADRRIDVGELGGRMFFNVAGIGLDAKVAADVSRLAIRRGLRTYMAAGARELLSYLPVDYTLESDAGSIHASALTVAIANSPQYGYFARIAPLAKMDDGQLDLVVVEARSLAGNLVRLPSLFTGGFHKRSGVLTSKIREVRIRSTARMLFHLDGEVIDGGRELTARVHPRALRVRA